MENKINEILEKAKSAGFATSITVGNLPDFDSLDVKEKIDDFKYLRLLADRYCMNLMALNGELIFDDVLSGGSPILSLTVGMGLMSFSRRVGLQGQVGEVEIWGRDEKQHFRSALELIKLIESALDEAEGGNEPWNT